MYTSIRLLFCLSYIYLFSFTFGQNVCNSKSCWWDSHSSVRWSNEIEIKNVDFFFWKIFLVLFAILVICQTASVYNGDNDDDENSLFRSLTPEQLAELDEYLSQKLADVSSSSSWGLAEESLDRNTRRPDESTMVKRDTLWTTTEVLDCVRRLKYSKNISKLDLATEMLNCYRRLKHSG